MYQALAVLTFCQSESHSLLSGTRPSFCSLRWLFCDSLFRGVEACQAPFVPRKFGLHSRCFNSSYRRGNITLPRGDPLARNGTLTSLPYLHYDYAKAVLTTFVVLRCGVLQTSKEFCLLFSQSFEWGWG